MSADDARSTRRERVDADVVARFRARLPANFPDCARRRPWLGPHVLTWPVLPRLAPVARQCSNLHSDLGLNGMPRRITQADSTPLRVRPDPCWRSFTNKIPNKSGMQSARIDQVSVDQAV